MPRRAWRTAPAPSSSPGRCERERRRPAIGDGRISQWCATPSYPFEISDDTAQGGWSPIEVSGHTVCKSKRWHDPDHWKCCFSFEETESWGCVCSCHAEDRRSTEERIRELRADPVFRERLAKSIDQNRRAPDRLAE